MYEDTPQELVHDLDRRGGLRRRTRSAGPVIGARRGDLDASRARAIASYHRAMYAPANIVVAAAGNVDHERLVELLERAAASGARARRTAAARPPAARRSRRRRGLRFQRKDTEQYHVCLGAPGISRSDRRRFAASLLDAILGGSASSRLFQEIREKRGMAYSVYSFASQYTDTGQIGVYVGTREENLADVPRDRRRADRRHRRREHPRRASSSARRRTSRAASLLSMESTSSRMSRLGKSLDHRHGDAVARPGDRRDRRRRGGRGRRAGGGAAGARAALRRRDRAERGAVPRGGRARDPGARRAQAA